MLPRAARAVDISRVQHAQYHFVVAILNWMQLEKNQNDTTSKVFLFFSFFFPLPKPTLLLCMELRDPPTIRKCAAGNPKPE